MGNQSDFVHLLVFACVSVKISNKAHDIHSLSVYLIWNYAWMKETIAINHAQTFKMCVYFHLRANKFSKKWVTHEICLCWSIISVSELMCQKKKRNKSHRFFWWSTFWGEFIIQILWEKKLSNLSWAMLNMSFSIVKKFQEESTWNGITPCANKNNLISKCNSADSRSLCFSECETHNLIRTIFLPRGMLSCHLIHWDRIIVMQSI